MSTTVRTVCCCGTEHTHQCPADWSHSTPGATAPTLLRDALTRAEQAEAETARQHDRANNAESQLADHEDTITRVRDWIAGEPVTARNEFGNGYREALRDIGDALDGSEPAAPTPKLIAVCDVPGPWGDHHQCIRPAGHDHAHEANDGCGWPAEQPTATTTAKEPS